LRRRPHAQRGERHDHCPNTQVLAVSRLLGAVPVCASTVVLITGPQSAMAAPPASSADRDCSDFDNQRQAQNYFIDRGGPRRDPDRLDADGNGVACEALPCPCSRAGARPRPQRPRRRAQTIRGRVTRVVDGDTIDVRSLERTRRRRYRVRLLGIDTPEVFGRVECGGRRASTHLRRLASGRRARLRTDPSQDTFDRYRRLLAYVRLRGGPDAALAQLRAGWARVYVYCGRPFRRVREFRRAQRSARRARRGVWGRCRGRFHTPARSAAAAAGLGPAATLASPAEAAEATAAARRCRPPTPTTVFGVRRLRTRRTTCRVARTLSARWRRQARCRPVDGGPAYRDCTLFPRGIPFRCYTEGTAVGDLTVECAARGRWLVRFRAWP
jgi:endonuclease YncB( thermonuclease family)